MAISSTNIFTVFQDVANTIRDKLQYSKEVYTIKPIDFASEILNLPQGETGGTYADPAELVEGTISTITNATDFIKPYTFAFCSNLSYASFSKCLTIGHNAFESAIALSEIHFPEAKQIGSSAFIDCKKLTDASFPKCTCINSNAFSNCTNLQTAAFSEAVFIKYGAFSNCTSLQSIYFPKAQYIDKYAFAACSNLSSIDLPNCLQINSNAFSGSFQHVALPKIKILDKNVFRGNNCNCSDFQYLDLPECRSIGWEALGATYFCTVSLPNCSYISDMATWTGILESLPSNALSELYLPRAQSIYRAFANYSTLKTVNLPVATYLRSTFRYCYNLSSISIPMVTAIYEAFENCSAISEISLPMITHLGYDAFMGCVKLTSVYIPNTVTLYDNANGFANCYNLKTIGKNYDGVLSNVLKISGRLPIAMFNNCSELETIALPGCNQLSACVFNNCQKLASVYLFGPSCQLSYGSSYVNKSYIYYTWEESGPFINTPLTNSSYLGIFGNLYVPSKYLSNYLNAEGFSLIADRIKSFPESLENKFIFQSEYCSNSMLSEIPAEKVNAVSILSWGFASCTALTNATMSLVEDIDEYAFYYCDNLSTVNLPKCSNFGQHAFTGCGNLATVSINSATTCLSSTTFYQCSNLTQINGLDNVRMVGSDVFGRCSSLSQISLPQAILIEDYAFDNCTNLTTVYAPECLWLKASAFAYCSNLSNITMPNIQDIESRAFLGCSKLTTLGDLSKAKKIGQGTFGSTGLTGTIKILNAEAIGPAAFANCQNLTKAIIGSASLNANVFANCANLREVHFQGVQVSGSIFEGCQNLTSLFLYNSVPVVFPYANMTIFGSNSTIPSIYVHDYLLSLYKTDSIWSSYSTNLVGLTDEEFEALENLNYSEEE